MATYRTIAASEVDADSPFTATLAAAYAGNVLGIIEGAAGAPPIQVGAFSGSVAGNVLLWASVSATITQDETVTVPQSHYRAVASVGVRFRAVVASQSGSARASFVRVRVGGSPVVLNSVSATTFMDITVLTGDVIYLNLVGGGGQGTTEITAHAEVYTSALRINGGG